MSCRTRVDTLEHEQALLKQSLEAGQVQKEIIYDETDKIQNVQQLEISKLKSMLLFREQESMNQQSKSKLDQDQIQNLKAEISRIKSIEQDFEDVKVSLCVVKNQHIRISCLAKVFMSWRISEKGKTFLVTFYVLSFIIFLRLF